MSSKEILTWKLYNDVQSTSDVARCRTVTREFMELVNESWRTPG